VQNTGEDGGESLYPQETLGVMGTMLYTPIYHIYTHIYHNETRTEIWAVVGMERDYWEHNEWLINRNFLQEGLWGSVWRKSVRVREEGKKSVFLTMSLSQVPVSHTYNARYLRG
jgi:hypothetical protein